VIPQEQNFGRGGGLQREIQFWKIQANVAHLSSSLHSRICQYGKLSLNTIKKPLPKNIMLQLSSIYDKYKEY
jgi:hypothetical protein